MDFSTLTEQNFMMYAIKHYENPHCATQEEFRQDLDRIISIKRLILRYMRNGDLKERLVLNHLIVLYNTFGEATTRILLYKLPLTTYPVLKSYLMFLNRIPYKRSATDFDLDKILPDMQVLNKLNGL